MNLNLDNDPQFAAVRAARAAWRRAPKGTLKRAAFELYQDAQRAVLRDQPRFGCLLIGFVYDLQREDRDGPLFARLVGAR